MVGGITKTMVVPFRSHKAFKSCSGLLPIVGGSAALLLLMYLIAMLSNAGNKCCFTLARNLLRFVDSLPLYFIGGLACWFSWNCQRLGDLAANTVVIRSPRLSEPDLDQLLAGKYNSLRQHPHLAARLRQRVSPGEAAIALQALVRRDEFDPAARVELFGELADHFRALIPFPAEATDGVADEQYIRNVVDVIYRSGTDKPMEKVAAA